MSDIAVNHHGTSFGKAVPHTVTRHSHPKARPETAHEKPAPTGIDYLNLVADAHHARTGDAINFQALSDITSQALANGNAHTGDARQPDVPPPDAPVTGPGQVPGQLPLPHMPTPTPNGGHTR